MDVTRLFVLKRIDMLNEVLRLTQGNLTNVTGNRPYSRSQENGFAALFPSCLEASKALERLGKAITPTCKHGV